MDVNGFAAYLKERNAGETEIHKTISTMREFENFLNASGMDIEHAGERDASAFADKLLVEGRDDEQTITALARYARFMRNNAVYVVFLALLDGGEVIGNFRRLIAERAGEDTERRIFEGLLMPTWGTDSRTKAKLMRVVMERAQTMMPPETLRDILSGCLHDLPDAYFLPLREKLKESGTFEAFIRQRRAEFLVQMEEHFQSGTLFYNQKVTKEVLEYLRGHEEISVGRLEDDGLRVTKIPYMADEWLKETDPVRKRYLYCHCPWARESIRGDSEVPLVPAAFCRCSAGFSKKPYEVALGRKLEVDVVKTVLNGDDTCEFMIHIPQDACKE